MDLVVSLRGLTVFVHNLFWLVLTISLLLHVSWLPVALLAIFSAQTLVMLVWVYKGPAALGLKLTEPTVAEGEGTTAVAPGGRRT